jgi:hypothetical protein
MKGFDRFDQYLGSYSMLKETVKWLKKVVLYLIICGLFYAFCTYKKFNPCIKIRYKKVLHETERFWTRKKKKEGSIYVEDSLLITSLHQEDPREIHLEGCQQTSAGIS